MRNASPGLAPNAYTIQRQAAGAVGSTIRRELGTLTRMLRLAYQNGKLLRLPMIHKPKDGPAREGFFEREQHEAVRAGPAARDDLVQAYGRELPAVVQCFTDDFDACIAHPRFPLRHRKVIRTTNLLERLCVEERRRTKIIAHAFGERPVVKLMCAAVIRAADRWRGLTVGEFEQRQLRAIREELDRAHAERVRPAVRPTASASAVKLSSRIRT